MRLTVGQRLVLPFLLMALLLVATGVLSSYNLNQLNANTEEILREHQPVLTNIAAIESGVLFHSLKVEQYVTTGNKAHLRAVLKLRGDVEANLAELESRTQGTEDQPRVQEIREAYDTYVSLSDGLQELYHQNPDDTGSVAGRQMRIAALLENAVLAKADALYAAQQSTAQELIRTNRYLYQTYFGITVISSVVLIVLAVALSVIITRSITVPIAHLVDATHKVTAGDLSARAEVRIRDEIGLLAGDFNTMATQLQDVIATLEQRVAERTRGLQAAAEVTRATTSVLDPDQLLRQVVSLVRDRFDLYYVGLFLLDQERGFAVLRAGTGEAGRKMLEQGHRLQVGGDSMIGQCTAKDEARISLDVGEEAVRFDNPLLPNTRSEMALPLRSRGRVIGAMTVQSVEQAAFDEADIAVMQTMADQVAVAIDNARLFAESQAALEEIENTHRRYLGQAWREYTRSQLVSGYAQTEAGTLPLGDTLLPEVEQAIAQRQPLVSDAERPADRSGEVPRSGEIPRSARNDGEARSDGEGRDDGAAPSTLVVPIMLRGQPIGALGVRDTGDGREWTSDDVAVAEAIAEQLALAADNLRLLDETQRRAAHERLTGQVATRVRETLDVESVLKTAVQEVRQALDLPEVVISLTTPGTGSPTAYVQESETKLSE